MSDSETIRKLFASQCEFVAGAATLDAIPAPVLPEIGFIGRSNVGKSSLVNALVGRKSLARTSQSPGATKQINFFRLDDALILVDLPGYGFARVSRTQSAEWQQLIFSYLRGRANLRRVVVLVDARRGVLPADKEAMKLLDESAVSYLVVLTKIDKLAPQEREPARALCLRDVSSGIAAYPDVYATSAVNGEGIDLLRAHIAALAAA
jgi:GTP-binding protein